MAAWFAFLYKHPVIALSLGGALGANARYWVGYWARSLPGAAAFPWGTFLVNVSGSFVLAVAAVLFLEKATPARRELFLLVGTGFCGAYTTFSTFGWETYRLAQEGRWGLALLNVAGSVVAGILAVAAGVWAAHRLAAGE